MTGAALLRDLRLSLEATIDQLPPDDNRRSRLARDREDRLLRVA